MKHLFLVLSIFGLFATAQAKVVSGKTQFVNIDLKSVVLEVSAKCNPPKFEDDTFHVYFSNDSYEEVSAYTEKGYAYKLLGKRCGPSVANQNSLSSEFETVQILMVNSAEAQDILDQALKNAWNSK